MGLLDQVLGSALPGMGRQPQRRGGMGQTIAAGVLLALLVKAARQHAQPAEGRSFDPSRGAGPNGGGLGGVLGGLGGILGGGGGLGSFLGGLGGAGALGGLIGQLQQKGYGQQVNSWVGSGQNQPLAPHQLADALGEDTVQDLQEQTGIPRESLLAELAHILPEAVHEATPNGRLPTDDELHKITHQ
ncbi:YidB family protein [Phenylobacterium deserti]|uniref:DUF937 domain-containing protein n=1 Tax=Phenylobacterium deserti TaxID=1914756 RepID=A0A328AF16_9CAUL|nr:hypothetical protein DJ018_12575 [Phenylobacterium deserti]